MTSALCETSFSVQNFYQNQAEKSGLRCSSFGSDDGIYMTFYYCSKGISCHEEKAKVDGCHWLQITYFDIQVFNFLFIII